MEYTIQKLAELAGVTTRTLRWYHRDVYKRQELDRRSHKIGNLKQFHVADHNT